MAYLTYQEYVDLGFTEVDKEDFDRLLRRASGVVDGVTNHFYQFNSLEEDRSSFRRTQFKKAVAAQIEYFQELGATNSHGLNEPTTVTIGRTTITSARGAQNAPQRSLVSNDVYFLLEKTGLLYAGIRSK